MAPTSELSVLFSGQLCALRRFRPSVSAAVAASLLVGAASGGCTGGLVASQVTPTWRVDLYAYVSMAIAAMQVQEKEIAALAVSSTNAADT